MKKQNVLMMAAMALVMLVAFACSKESQTEMAPATQETGSEAIIDHLCWEPPTDVVVACPAVYAPVCACGVITFGNSCEAEAMGFKNYEQGSCLQNRCKVEAISYVLGDVQCAAVYQPVCGCDGKTYSNYCAAVASGVLAWVPGECRGGVTVNPPPINDIVIDP